LLVPKLFFAYSGANIEISVQNGNDDLKSTACPEQGPSLLDNPGFFFVPVG